MTKQDALVELKTVRQNLNKLVEIAVSFGGSDEVVKDLMLKRGYNDTAMFNTLKEVGLFKVDDFLGLVSAYDLSDLTNEHYGLFDKQGRGLLDGRFCVPIRSISGDVTAIVGWYSDGRKYITTPTFGFSRDAQFFNIECYKDCVEREQGNVFLVEGIFDALSLRSIGLSALGNMGLPLSPIKRNILNRFNKVIAIPDADRAGHGVLSMDRGPAKDKWIIDTDKTYVLLQVDGVKDVDDLIKNYDCKADLEECKSGGYLKILK